ncbi:helix-turn-helix domain-containing protein [Xanthomonas campestris]|uniref:helix-turn-helix domain-containing protein n=1 Tax=Xanthomonas campestris TaxID=339 RepID=UPI00388F138C
MTVGKRLKDERKRLGLTQDEMAVQLGLTRYAQLNFEKDINLPGGAYLLAALDRGVDVMYVLSGQRTQLDPADRLLLSAFKDASPAARNAALAALGLLSDASSSKASPGPVLSFNNNEIGSVISTNAPIDQSNMQITVGGRKKRSPDQPKHRTVGPRKRVRYRQRPADV